jgi:shikimate kinase
MTEPANRVYLVGFMGSGKTTVGRVLAERLDSPFVDLDQAFESMAGTTIKESFERHGEAWFRERESELLRGTGALPKAVIALGGGTFVAPANREFVQESGVSVFLDASFDLIASRLAGKAVDRPLFRDLAEARQLYDTRLPCYKMANWTVPVKESDRVDAVVRRIEDLLVRGEGLGSGGR